MSKTQRIKYDEAARLRLAVGRLARRLRQEAEIDVTPSQLSALATLDRGGAMTIGELATVECIRPPTMTRIVAALEESELVKRSADPDDGRACRVSITDKGIAAVKRIRDARSAFLAARLGALDANEVASIRAALPALERLLEVAEDK
ncbi:MAG: MarR family transcriptional regulator [Acidobacteria bacterium]|nr:MAG: MarR family transcriptional regulator [Acidobacteriota bacterium]